MIKYEAFLSACCDGDLCKVSTLYEQYPRDLNPNQRYGEHGMNALLQASFYGQAHIVQYLIDHAAGNLTTYGMWSLSSLIEAAGEGWIATVEYLLNQGMDPNYMDGDGETAIVNACRNGHIHIVRCLIEHGADCEHHEDNGLTVLLYADKAGCLDLAIYLVDVVGMNVNATDGDDDNLVNLKTNHTPFDRNIDVFRFYLSRGFNIHYISKNEGLSVLMCLCTCFQWSKIIEFVIDYGCDIDHQSHNGETSLMRVILTESEENARLILSRGKCSINIQDENGETALMKLVRRGPLSLVRYFVEVGNANSNIQNKYGLSCFDIPFIPASVAEYLYQRNTPHYNEPNRK